MGGINFAAPFALLKPIDVDPAKFAAEYQNLAALAQERQVRQQQMAASQQAMQLGALNIQKQQLLNQDQNLIRNRMPQLLNDPAFRNQDGTFNYSKGLEQLESEGLGPDTADQLQTRIENFNKAHEEAFRNHAEAENFRSQAQDRERKAAQTVFDAMGNFGLDHLDESNPAVFEGFLHNVGDIYKDQPAVKARVDDMLTRIQADPNHMDLVAKSLGNMLSPEALTARQTRAKEAQEITASKALAAKNQAEADKAAYELTLMQGAGANSDAAGDKLIDSILPPDQFKTDNPNFKAQLKGVTNPDYKEAAKERSDIIKQARELATSRSPEANQAAADKAAAVATAEEPSKVRVAAAEGAARAQATFAAGGLTPDDIARAGEQYARTGVMPALGRDSVTRAQIVKAGNAWARDQGLSPADVVTMQAAYAGDKESLKNFQKQRDQIVSFEQTAQKNLNQFLDLAGKIPDTGVPWLNMPIRMLDAKLVGSENMAAINAARQVANNEIAKVTSGGGMSGVLSDSARQEVSSYNPQNATFAQTKAVARILQQDMANRHQSMDSTLNDIKSRIGGGGTSTTPVQTAPKATKRFNPQTKRLEDIP